MTMTKMTPMTKANSSKQAANATYDSPCVVVVLLSLLVATFTVSLWRKTVRESLVIGAP